jgi:hypothetical protein
MVSVILWLDEFDGRAQRTVGLAEDQAGGWWGEMRDPWVGYAGAE